MRTQWIILGTLLSTTAFANYTQLSLGLGANSMKTSSTKVVGTAPAASSITNGKNSTRFVPSVEDIFHLSVAKQWDWTIGGQYLFSPKTENNITFISGDPGSIKLKVISNTLLLNTGMDYHPTSRFDIGLFGGLGASYNTVTGDLFSNGTRAGSFNTKKSWRMSWDLGTALNYQLATRWALGLQYQFIRTNNAPSGKFSNSQYVSAKTNRQVYMATISYLFNKTHG